ncbi:MAG: F0F1 ATP synthase subunit beta, partial [Duncaniella sp.]|nr:F0F1 ATP synthase subunit beta [Duncaniella sp.]
MSEKYGKIAQVIGPVVDVIFDGDDNIIPPIYTALKVDKPDGSYLILEVEQHIGEDTVRCVAMESTDGLQRGTRVDSLERPIAVPTGEQVKGRLLNVIGNAIDRLPELNRDSLRPIHQPAPGFEELTIGTEILYT